MLKTPDKWNLRQNYGDDFKSVTVNGENDTRDWTKITDWQNYIVQPYIQPKSFQLKQGEKTQDIRITSQNLFFNGKVNGPGVFKTNFVPNQKKIILPYIME